MGTRPWQSLIRNWSIYRHVSGKRLSANMVFFFNDPATTEIYTLSLHDALPISPSPRLAAATASGMSKSVARSFGQVRSEEHTSELQSRRDLVCRLLLEKKK